MADDRRRAVDCHTDRRVDRERRKSDVRLSRRFKACARSRSSERECAAARIAGYLRGMKMPSKKLIRFVGGLLLYAAAATAQAQLPWSDETHQIAFGDFNGDGRTDVLYIARNSGQSSGIAMSNGIGPYATLQTWASNFLGIAWHSGTYEPIVADFNGDGKADLF